MDLPRLRDLITRYFNDSELRDLCFDLSINYENLGSDNKAAKARELVTYCQRRDRLAELEAACRRLRPNAFTDSDLPSIEPTPQGNHNVPRLQIEFEQSFCDLSPTTLFDVGDKVRDGYWVRVRIKNNGELPAINCIGKLIEIRDRHGQRISRYDPEILAWRGGRQPVTLMPLRDFEYLDVWCSGVNASYMLVRANNPNIQGSDLKFKRGIYSIDVAVYAENAAPSIRTFRVEWEGAYNEIKMF